MFEEEVSLKNQEVVFVSLIKTKDNYIFSAVTRTGEIVGKCVFEICTLEVIPFKNGQDKFLLKEKNEFNGNISSKIVNLDFLKANNIKVNSKINICKLNQIEISNEKFFKVGLGTTLVKRMEKFAISKNCNEIYGWFYPNGNFWHGASTFYSKNGFSFKKDENNMTIITKNISKVNVKE